MEDRGHGRGGRGGMRTEGGGEGEQKRRTPHLATWSTETKRNASAAIETDRNRMSKWNRPIPDQSVDRDFYWMEWIDSKHFNQHRICKYTVNTLAFPLDCC